MAKHRISERYTRLRRRMWRRGLLGIGGLAFIACSLVTDCYASRISPHRWVYANSFFTVIKVGYYEGQLNANRAQWQGDIYVNTDVLASWSDLYSQRVPPLLPKAWALRGGWINVIVPLWPVPAFFLGSAAVWWRVALIEKRRHFCICGYALAGLTSDTCPECGRAIKKPADA